jgi:hypothetical protein
MKATDLDPDELARISVSLESLREHLEADLASVKQLPEYEIGQMLREQSLTSRARAVALCARLVELREIIDSRRRTLERLRTWMRQIRGGVRPH